MFHLDQQQQKAFIVVGGAVEVLQCRGSHGGSGVWSLPLMLRNLPSSLPRELEWRSRSKEVGWLVW